LIFQIGQSDLGLKDRSYYTKEDEVTIAYKDYIRDLAQALNNGVSVNDIDVNAIFDFEKEIAQVNLSCSIYVSYLFFLHPVPFDSK
jgi:predicted metalloendopeptidase